MNTRAAHRSFAAEGVWHTRVNGIRLGGIRAETKNAGVWDGKLRARVRGDVHVSREDLDACFCAAGKRDGDGLLYGGGAVGDFGDRDLDRFGAALGAPVVDVAAGGSARSARVKIKRRVGTAVFVEIRNHLAGCPAEMPERNLMSDEKAASRLTELAQGLNRIDAARYPALAAKISAIFLPT